MEEEANKSRSLRIDLVLESFLDFVFLEEDALVLLLLLLLDDDFFFVLLVFLGGGYS